MFNHPFQIITQDQVSIHFLSYSAALITAAQMANHRIWIFCYVLHANLNRQNDPVTHFLTILRNRHAKGCDVRFILDTPQITKQNYACNQYAMRHLMEWGIQFCTTPPKITSHAKCVLIDNKVLFIGSHNLAASSLQNPLDCTVELRNEFLIRSFAETYEMVWRDASMVTYTPEEIPPAKYYG